MFIKPLPGISRLGRKTGIQNGRINIGVIGTGWTGGIRANALAKSPYIEGLHVAEINPERLAEIMAETNPASSTDHWEDLIKNDEIQQLLCQRRQKPRIIP